MNQPLIIHLPHPTVNLTYTSDWHLTDVPPGRRTGSYAEEILAKVRYVAALTHKLNGRSICGGDVCHIKNPESRANSFSLERRISLALQEFPDRQVYGAIGNHDINQDRMDSLPKQMLGSLIASGVYHDLTAQHVIFENADRTVRVLVEAYPYADDEVTLARVLAASPRPEGITYRIAVLHQYGHPGGEGSMFGHRTIGYDELAHLDYDVMLWGHDHSREETVQVGNVTHIRLGSLSRASLAGDEVNRPVSVAVLGFTPDQIKYREQVIPVKPLELAFVAADKPVERARDNSEVVEFFKSMEDAVARLGSEMGTSDTSLLGTPPSESLQERDVLIRLAGEDKKLADYACQRCGL